MIKEIIFIAPGNSIHSFKWISYIKKHYDGNIYWISFYGNDYSIPGVKQILFNRNIKGILTSIFFLKKKTKGVIHIHSLGFHLLFFFSSLFFLSNKIICTPWGSDLIFGKSNFIKKFLLKNIFKSSYLITCDAFFMKETIKKIYHLSNVKIINFGVDTDKFFLQKRKIFKQKTLKLLSIRNLEEIYNVECIIKMIEIITRKGLDVKLSIFGDGSSSQKLKRLVTEKSLDNKVSFLGRYSQENLVKILFEHDLYISMARSDAGIASSTAEAMSTGMICLVSDVAENSLWISHNVSGFLIKDNNHEDLAKYIELIFKDKINIDNFGVKARDKIVACNSINNEMKKMNKIYQSIQGSFEQ